MASKRLKRRKKLPLEPRMGLRQRQALAGAVLEVEGSEV